jgi:hypothetical protein
MTAHDQHLCTPASNPGASASDAVGRDNRYSASDAVPVIVWRTTPDEPNAASDTDIGDRPLTARLAHHLVAIYSAVHSTVVDFDADDNLRHAVDANGRRYMAVASPPDLTTLTAQRQSAVLIVVRWPRPATHAAQDAHGLLIACQHHLAEDGSVIVAVTAATAGQTGTTYADHERTLLAAARAAGLRHLHDIVALTAADGRDSFTYTTVQPETTSRDTDTEIARGNASSTLMVFGRPRTRP